MSDDVVTAYVRYSHTLLRARAANALRLAGAVDAQRRTNLLGAATHTKARQLCKEAFVRGSAPTQLPLRTTWCVQAYRDFPGLYELELRVVTQDRSDQALVSNLTLSGFSWDSAMRFSRRYLESFQ